MNMNMSISSVAPNHRWQVVGIDGHNRACVSSIFGHFGNCRHDESLFIKKRVTDGISCIPVYDDVEHEAKFFLVPAILSLADVLSGTY